MSKAAGRTHKINKQARKSKSILGMARRSHMGYAACHATSVWKVSLLPYVHFQVGCHGGSSPPSASAPLMMMISLYEPLLLPLQDEEREEMKDIMDMKRVHQKYVLRRKNRKNPFDDSADLPMDAASEVKKA